MLSDKKTTWLFFLFITLFTLHITPATYVNANFLSQFFDFKYVGFIYILASIATILTVLGLRDKLSRFGNYKVFTFSLLFEIITLTLLILSQSALVAVISIIGLFVSYAIAFICLDIFLEKHTFNQETGKIRGYYLTSINTAFILGPFIASILLSNENFKNVYIFMLFLVFPIIFLAQELFKDFKDDVYTQIKIIKGFKKIRKDQDIYSTVMSSFILQFFYAWMVIYLPIYLVQNIGFSFAEVGLIMSIALIPFILVQSTAGRLADQIYGEKEMLVIGFIVLSIFTGLISFIDSTNISVWIAVLFMTRVGASMIEIMTETHIFKRINSGDINTISVFRVLNPIALISGSLVGSFFLQIISFNMLFLVLSGITLYGLRYALAITDTK